MANQSAKRLTAIAHHEAGHVYAAYRAGRQIHGVSISTEPGEKGEYGKSQHVNPLFGQDIPDGDPRLSDLGTWELVISYAGPEAEKRIDPRRKVAPSDLAEQQNIISCITNLTTDECDQYLRSVKRDTRELVKDG